MVVEICSIRYYKFINGFKEILKNPSIKKDRRIEKEKKKSKYVIANSFPYLLKKLETLSIPSYKYEQLETVIKRGKTFDQLMNGELLDFYRKLYDEMKLKKQRLSPKELAKAELCLMKAMGYVHLIEYQKKSVVYFRTKLGEEINNFIAEKRISPSNISKVIILGSLLFPTKLRLLYLLYKITPNPEEMFRILLSKLYTRELISFERNALEIIEEIYYTNYFKTRLKRKKKEYVVETFLLWKILPSINLYINQYIDFESFARINNYVRTDDPYTGFPEFFKKFEPSIDTLKDKLLVDFAQYVSKKYKEINEYLQPLLYYV
jgi:hypothetical protein